MTIHAVIFDDGHLLIDGKSWFTREAYLSNAGFSQKSVQKPYMHCDSGFSEKLTILSTTLFRPVNGFESVKNKNK